MPIFRTRKFTFFPFLILFKRIESIDMTPCVISFLVKIIHAARCPFKYELMTFSTRLSYTSDIGDRMLLVFIVYDHIYNHGFAFDVSLSACYVQLMTAMTYKVSSPHRSSDDP